METVRIPMLLSPEAQPDSSGPMAELLALCGKLEEDAGVRMVSFFPVQPWLDIQGTASVALVLTNGERKLARKTAEILRL